MTPDEKLLTHIGTHSESIHNYALIAEWTGRSLSEIMNVAIDALYHQLQHECMEIRSVEHLDVLNTDEYRAVWARAFQQIWMDQMETNEE